MQEDDGGRDGVEDAIWAFADAGGEGGDREGVAGTGGVVFEGRRAAGSHESGAVVSAGHSVSALAEERCGGGLLPAGMGSQAERSALYAGGGGDEDHSRAVG